MLCSCSSATFQIAQHNTTRITPTQTINRTNDFSASTPEKGVKNWRCSSGDSVNLEKCLLDFCVHLGMVSVELPSKIQVSLLNRYTAQCNINQQVHMEFCPEAHISLQTDILQEPTEIYAYSPLCACMSCVRVLWRAHLFKIRERHVHYSFELTI